MILKTKPFILTSVYHDEHPGNVILTPEIFNVAFAVEDLYIILILLLLSAQHFQLIKIFPFLMLLLNIG